MSVQSELTRIQTAKADLKTVLESKGIVVSSATTIDGYPALVSSIITGTTTSDFVAAVEGTATAVTIPDGVTVIGTAAFDRCSNLTAVTIPASVTSLQAEAFTLCTALTSITCYATTAPTLGSAVFYNMTSAGTLYVPTGSDYSTWLAALPSGWQISYI